MPFVFGNSPGFVGTVKNNCTDFNDLSASAENNQTDHHCLSQLIINFANFVVKMFEVDNRSPIKKWKSLTKVNKTICARCDGILGFCTPEGANGALGCTKHHGV